MNSDISDETSGQLMAEQSKQQWAQYKVWQDSLREEDREVLRYIHRFSISDIFRVYQIASIMRSHGNPVKINDVLWSIFNKDMQEFFLKRQMGLLRNIYFSMAELLTSEGRHEAALEKYLAVVFCDANGCRNIDPVAGLPFRPNDAPKEPFPGVVTRIAQAINSGGLDLNKAKQMMLVVCSSYFRGYDQLGMSVEPSAAWQWLEPDLASAVNSGTKRRGPKKPPPIIPANLSLPDLPSKNLSS